jgi:hypothetical protein
MADTGIKENDTNASCGQKILDCLKMGQISSWNLALRFFLDDVLFRISCQRLLSFAP